jgi:NADPH:quinone reductase
MHGWFCDTLNGVDGLTWREAPTPTPGPQDILVGVRAASLNFPDVLTVQGKYQVKPPLPFSPGSEFSGEVLAVGADVQHLKAGDRVACLGTHGGFATHAVVNAQTAWPIPSSMPYTDAAAFAFTYGTSFHALMDRAALVAGETVLVLGAAGGVGSAALHIAKAAGARVVAVVSSDAKAQWCAQQGADEAISLASVDATGLREAIKKATAGRGPDVIYDAVGGALAEPSFRSIAWRGRYLVVGFAAGPIPALPWNLALLKGASIAGVFWGDYVRREPMAFRKDMVQLLTWYAKGSVRPALDAVLPMVSVRQAYAAMTERRVKGKVVLTNEG